LTFPETGEIIELASEELFLIDKEDFLGIIDLNSRSGEISREGLDRGGGLWQAGFRHVAKEAADRSEFGSRGRSFGIFRTQTGNKGIRPGLTRDARGGREMATVYSPSTGDSAKVRFAHRFKLVVTNPSKKSDDSATRRRLFAEAPDAGHTRRGSEAGEMWTRNAEAPDAGYGR